MALNARQRAAYQGLFAAYSPDAKSIDATTGKVSPNARYSLELVNEACLFISTPNISDEVTGMGRGKRPNQFTTNHIHCDISLTLKEAWVIQDLRPGSTYGDLYLIQGAPEKHPSSGSRSTNYQACELATQETRPLGVMTSPAFFTPSLNFSDARNSQYLAML